MSEEMNNEINKPANPNRHGSYERQDLQVPAILYFLLGLLVVTAIGIVGLRGVFAYLERHEKSSQPAVSPLVARVPEDSRHVAPGYAQSAFPNPKLEEDERGQLDDIRLKEENTLYTYGWVDEKNGTVRIPIERAMDLIVQRGLAVRPQGGAGQAPAAKTETSNKQSTNNQSPNKVKKK